MLLILQTPITSPLLKLTSNELNRLAVDCFLAIMRYMGDHPMAKNQTEVDCVYTVLVVSCAENPCLLSCFDVVTFSFFHRTVIDILN